MLDILLKNLLIRKFGGNRAARAIVLLVLFYTISGFVFLPWGIKHFLTHNWADRIQHTVQVRDVRFNPYLLKLQIDGLQILEGDNAPLLAFEQFVFDYEALSAFRLEFGIEQLSLDKPYVKLEADGQGSYTLLPVLAGGSEAHSKTETGSAPLPSVLLRKLDIRDGTIDYRDAHRAGGFHQLVDLQSFSINDFHTKKEGHANRLVVELRDRDAGAVSIDTAVELQPLQISGKLALQNLNLAPVWQWLMLPVNFQLHPPRFDLSTQFDVKMLQALDLSLSAGSVTLREFALSNKSAPDAPVIRLPLLSVNAMQVNLQKQTMEIGTVQASDGWLDVVMDKRGAINLQALFAPADTVAASAQPAQMSTQAVAPPKPWDVLIHQLAVSNYTVQFRDEKPAENFSATLSPISITVNEWKPLAADPFAVQIKTGISDGKMQQPAQIAVDAHLQLTPLMADAHLDVQQLPLSMATPYIHEAVRADIDSGVARAGFDIHFEAGSTAKMSAEGAAQIDRLDVHERGTDRKLVSWDKLDIAALSYHLQDNALGIGKITLDKLNTGFVINADGTTNVHDLLVGKKQEETKAVTQAPASPMQINIGTVELHDADIGFADLSMKPNFRVAMQQLSGGIKGLSSDPKTQAAIDLKGKVDRYAPVTIKGTLNPLAPKPSMDAHMAFNNLELTTFTPYSGTYAGFKIDKGQLSLDIDYKLVNDKVQGKNRIVVNQLQLGESVKSNKAVNLPLRLAIALLRDDKGVIDLGFEVSGDLSDPKFSVGGIVWKVLSNMIMKVVTSPFKVLSGLLGGSADEDMDQIVFVAGQDQIDPAAVNKLKKVAGVLEKRAGLHLDIQGNGIADQDRPARQKQKLLSALQENNKIPVDAFLSSQAAQDNGDAYKVLARYYKKQRSDEIGDIEDRIKEDMKARGEKADRKALQRLAYEQAWQRLQDGIVVTDEELRQLAMQRALRIKEVMVEQYHVPADRVFVQDANYDPAKASLTTRLSLDAK